MRSSHNLVKNDTVRICEWSKNEQMILEGQLLKMQQEGQKVNDISSILKISGLFPSKSIQQITSRLKWIQIPYQSRPSWVDYSRNESFYAAYIEQQPTQKQQSLMTFTPRQRTTSIGSKDIFLPMANRQEDVVGHRKRSYSIQEEMSEDHSPRKITPRHQNTPTHGAHKSVGASIMIGTSSPHTPRVYRPHSPTAHPVVQRSVPNMLSTISQITQENERLMVTLESQFNQNKSGTQQIDMGTFTQIINNFNQILNMSGEVTHVPLPYFSGYLELPNELQNVFPFVQTSIGLRFSFDYQTQNYSFRNISPVSSPNSSTKLSQ
ncbi:Myb-like domain-containing protein [Entamoeba marina]